MTLFLYFFASKISSKNLTNLSTWHYPLDVIKKTSVYTGVFVSKTPATCVLKISRVAQEIKASLISFVFADDNGDISARVNAA